MEKNRRKERRERERGKSYIKSGKKEINKETW